jgi:1-acyl-sn-glycerol-3-phosphate acyltransferase
MAKKVLGNDPFARGKKESARKSEEKMASSGNATLKLLQNESESAGKKKVNSALAQELNRALHDVGNVDDQIKELEAKLEILTSTYEDRINDLMQKMEEGRVVERPAIDKMVGWLADLLERYAQLFKLSTYQEAYRSFSMLVTADEVDEFGYDRKFEEMVLPLMKFFYSTWWRVETIGIRNVPDSGRALIVANHSGVLPYDGAVIKMDVQYNHPTNREVRPLVEDFAFNFPFLGQIIQRIGGVRACQENGTRLLEKDEVVAVFPEGVKGIGKYYNKRYQLQRFGRGGYVKLAMRTGSPIIPVAVIGAEEIHPMIARAPIIARAAGVPYFPITPTFPLMGLLGAIPLPSKWYIVYGDPIPMEQYPASALEDQILINKVSEKIRATIQEMIYDVLKRRKSIWFG